jgi:hypothetical protein
MAKVRIINIDDVFSTSPFFAAASGCRLNTSCTPMFLPSLNNARYKSWKLPSCSSGW